MNETQMTPKLRDQTSVIQTPDTESVVIVASDEEPGIRRKGGAEDVRPQNLCTEHRLSRRRFQHLHRTTAVNSHLRSIR